MTTSLFMLVLVLCMLLVFTVQLEDPSKVYGLFIKDIWIMPCRTLKHLLNAK